MTQQTLERLLRQHKDSVYRQMIRVCNHREDAEDALASAILLAIKSGDQLASQEAFAAWLKTIATRVCLRMKRNQKFAPVMAELENLAVPIEQDGMEMSVLKGCVQDAVQSLPERYKLLYWKVEIEEQTVPEAAESLQISLAAAKSRLLRARAMVRAQLDQSICSS